MGITCCSYKLTLLPIKYIEIDQMTDHHVMSFSASASEYEMGQKCLQLETNLTRYYKCLLS